MSFTGIVREVVPKGDLEGRTHLAAIDTLDKTQLFIRFVEPSRENKICHFSVGKDGITLYTTHDERNELRETWVGLGGFSFLLQLFATISYTRRQLAETDRTVQEIPWTKYVPGWAQDERMRGMLKYETAMAALLGLPNKEAFQPDASSLLHAMQIIARYNHIIAQKEKP